MPLYSCLCNVTLGHIACHIQLIFITCFLCMSLVATYRCLPPFSPRVVSPYLHSSPTCLALAVEGASESADKAIGESKDRLQAHGQTVRVIQRLFKGGYRFDTLLRAQGVLQGNNTVSLAPIRLSETSDF